MFDTVMRVAAYYSRLAPGQSRRSGGMGLVSGCVTAVCDIRFVLWFLSKLGKWASLSLSLFGTGGLANRLALLTITGVCLFRNSLGSMTT